MNCFRQISRVSSRLFHTVQLPCGDHMPVIGLGTWQSSPENVQCAVWTALNVGYRHIDTAFSYQNETAIGEILCRWVEERRGPREGIFIVTKLDCLQLPMWGNRPQDVHKYVELSLKRLQLSYIDLYLIHAPFGFVPNKTGEGPEMGLNGSPAVDCLTDICAIWEMLEYEVDAQKIRAIGVSNFNIEQLERVARKARILPSSVQVELHAFCQQADLRKYCKRLGIPVTAYSSLGTPGSKVSLGQKYNMKETKFPDLLNHPLVLELAEKFCKTPAQILLRHQVQNDIVVIPKSITRERIIENFQIFDFELCKEDMCCMDALDLGHFGRILDFRFLKGIENHPEYPFKQLELERAAGS